MRELTSVEVLNVSGAWAKSLEDAARGAALGAVAGGAIGMTLGGKWGGAGGWGFGALAQLVGYAVTPLVATVWGAIGGAIVGGDEALPIIKDILHTSLPSVAGGSPNHGTLA
ncbi:MULTISPECIES: hypothetical protein [Burkholderia]|uniref:DUF5862 domain-containing protein n=1 Tax=Burkholderia cepacia TaxID=292 RepID=A0AA88ZA84_BURCE|nr:MULTISPECIES: hypothetical protein [Burkholderia]KGC04044.1 hypothetical protein DM43_5462 [Burkholderia cepacia]